MRNESVCPPTQSDKGSIDCNYECFDIYEKYNGIIKRANESYTLALKAGANVINIKKESEQNITNNKAIRKTLLHLNGNVRKQYTVKVN